METLYQNIKCPELKGQKLIKDSKLFHWIDVDFVNFGANKPTGKTQKINLEVKELTQDSTFKKMFSNPEKMALSQEQILWFIKNHKDKLRYNGDECAIFFLFKSGDNFFVASVYVYGGDGLHVSVYRLGFDHVWDAVYRHRLVLPQLTNTLTLENLKTLPEILEINGVKYKKICRRMVKNNK